MPKKTLQNKLLEFGLLGGAGITAILNGGCTAAGDAFAREFTKNMIVHTAAEAISHEVNPSETNVYVDNSGNNSQPITPEVKNTLPENVVFSSGKYNPAEGYTWVNPDNQKDLRVMPENVVFSSGKYSPASGYTWDNPDNPNNLSVIRIQEPNAMPLGLLSFNKYIDLNKDGMFDRNEFFGLNKKSFNLDKEGMGVVLSLSKKGEIIFRTWTEQGELIQEIPLYNPGVVGGVTGINGSEEEGNFMDELKKAGPGRYRITANAEGIEETFSIDLEIERNKNVKENTKK